MKIAISEMNFLGHLKVDYDRKKSSGMIGFLSAFCGQKGRRKSVHSEVFSHFVHNGIDYISLSLIGSKSFGARMNALYSMNRLFSTLFFYYFKSSFNVSHFERGSIIIMHELGTIFFCWN